ncbi:MAG: Rrf2 family transcriptional regulator [Pirellulaceae bacterium]|nr:Rrf2 family transcriptional regulator [Pirellulaceae bacterium]
MLCLSKKTDYALSALAYLAGARDVASARQIADAKNLPLPLLMKILKCLHHHKILFSTRGVHGGYRLSADLERTSLFDLVAMMECPDKPDECGCMDHAVSPLARMRASRRVADQQAGDQPSTTRAGAVHTPAGALQLKLVRFLQNVTLAELIKPARRVELPVEHGRSSGAVRRHAYAHSS